MHESKVIITTIKASQYLMESKINSLKYQVKMKPLVNCVLLVTGQLLTQINCIFFAALGFGVLTVGLSFLATQLGAILQVTDFGFFHNYFFIFIMAIF